MNSNGKSTLINGNDPLKVHSFIIMRINFDCSIAASACGCEGGSFKISLLRIVNSSALILMTIDPSRHTTQASNGDVCSAIDCPASSENAVTLPFLCFTNDDETIALCCTSGSDMIEFMTFLIKMGIGERRGRDSNPRYSCEYTGFRDRLFQPLRHLSNEQKIPTCIGISGEGGIRTHGTVAGTPPFQGGQFNHSCTSPGQLHINISKIFIFPKSLTLQNIFYILFDIIARNNSILSTVQQ